MQHKRIIALTLALMLVFSGIPMKYTAQAAEKSVTSMTFEELKTIFNKVLDKISEVDPGTKNILFKLIKADIQEDIDMLIKNFTEDAAEGNGAYLTYAQKDKYIYSRGISEEDYERAIGLFKLFEIFTPEERVQIIDDIEEGKTPELLEQEEEILAKIALNFPSLEKEIQSVEPNFDLGMYVFALNAVQGKLSGPVVKDDPNNPEKIVIEIPDQINGVNVKEVVDAALAGLEIKGHTFTSYDEMTQVFVDQINERLDAEEMKTLKEVLAKYDMYKFPEVDIQKPVITLKGDQTITLKQGETYKDPGVEAIDNVDGDITEKVVKTVEKDGEKVSGVDTNVPGTYTIKYNVSDAAGNAADEVERTVIVIKVVTLDPSDIEEEETADGTHEMVAEIPNLEADDSGKTEAAIVKLPLKEKVKQELGISGEQTIEISLPPLNVGAGKKPVIKIKKAPEKVSKDKKVLAIAIEISGYDHKTQTVTLILPIPEGVLNPGAFHRTNERWEIRKVKTAENGQIEFETDLSSVAITDQIEVPTLISTSKSTNSVTLKWTSSLTNATYEVFKNGSKVATTSDKTYTVTGLNANTAYNFKVRAVDQDGFESDFSNTVAVTTNSTSGGSSGGGGGGSLYSGTTVEANERAKITREDATVEIPENAFGKDMKVKIETLSDAKVEKLPMPENTKLISKVFEITKDKEGNFEKPVTITLPFDKAKVDLDQYNLAIYWLDETKEQWIKLDKIVLDSKTGKVSGETNHFTKFAVLAVEKILLPEDVVGHWAQENIKKLIGLGAISGYPDGTFKPNNQITRAEFVTVLIKAFHLEAQIGTIFEDTKDHWAKDYIATATAHGIVSGYDDKQFGPNDLITREQMAVMIVKASMLKAEMNEMNFKDADQIADWAQKYVATAAKEGFVGGYPDATFKPKANATRAEAMTIIANAIK